MLAANLRRNTTDKFIDDFHIISNIGTKSELLFSYFPTDNVDNPAPAGFNKLGG
jgi:hypothetical protein